ncbi:Lipid phosphate phosphatase 1 [Colletotrichum orbiculare MAFF 240422]|uniref:Lipid phosphate phosphatase 1 n=2 Tax=Colletotrichum orbiculare species complex TaxID=2707354 RepID=N4V2P7_COLOR|nr:Lipid phosphate phosphatase 1 [Colletotrichum orbiculare MAFF 240422]TDZ35656.1 Lipid phosphate phosphatase 1 [Colletotrichum spinosum]
MGLFSKRSQAAGPANGHHANGATTGHAHGNGISNGRKGHAAEPYTMARRPTFGQWLKGTLLDIITMICMGALGLGIYMAPPAPNRSFAVTFADGEVVYPQFAYPMRNEIIPIWLAAFLASVIPIVIILLMQIRIRSFWDVNNAVIGLLYSLITAAVFQVFIKFLIGGLRPHFLEACQPDLSRVTSNQGGIARSGYSAAGFQSLYVTKEVCTGDMKEINDSLESFPSGHTTAAFAGFVYLYLYLNAKLKVFSDYHPSMWKMIVIYIPILGAVLIGGALTIDEFHNWYDIFAGAAIGIVFAFSSYRMTYAAVWDFRFNHIPLNRGQAFSYGPDAELYDAVFTRKAGWGARGGGGGLLHREKHAHHHNGMGAGNHHDGMGTGMPGTNDYGVASRKPVGSGSRAPDQMV